MTNNLKGALWAILAVSLFSIVSAMAKQASFQFHILQILFIRQLVVFLSVTPTILNNSRYLLRPANPKLHMLRLLGAFGALSLSLWAIAVLPLTTATVLMFSQTFFISLLAMWFLKEPVGIHRISAVVIGFGGVLIVLRPNADSFANTGSLIAIAAAICAAITITCVRRLSQTEKTGVLLSYQAVFVGVLSGAPMLWLWKTPSTSELVFLISMGIIATLAQWIGVKAIRLAQISAIAGIEYVKLLYAIGIGFWVFAETPETHVLIGAAIIVGTSFYTIMREAKR